MNKRRFFIPHPVAVYFILLLLVILASWMGTVYQLRGVGQGNPLTLRSLLEAQGVRWMIRHFPTSISQAPVGNALLLLSGLGVLGCSGLSNAVVRAIRRSGISYKERLGLRLACIVTAICLVLLLMGLFTGQRVLLGVTGSLLSGPIPDGAVFLLFTAVTLASVVFGYTADRFRDADDLIDALTCLIPRYAAFFLTLMIASQILAALDYSGLTGLADMNPTSLRWFKFVLWWLPLPIIHLRDKSRQSHF